MENNTVQQDNTSDPRSIDPVIAPDAPGKPESKPASAGAGGLPWGFVAIAGGVFYLMSNKANLAGDGAFIYVIGAIVVGVLSANNLTRQG